MTLLPVAPPTEPRRLLVVHRQRVFAEALAARLAREPRFEVVGAVTRCAPALALAASRRPSVVVLDWGLDDEEPAEVAARLRVLQSPPALVVLSDEDAPELVIESMRSGALSWVPGTSRVELLLEALQRAAVGERWLPDALLGPVLDRLLDQPGGKDPSPLGVLTDRELDVLRCMVAGLDQSAIARRMFLSPNTVRTHRRRTLAKLGVHSSLEAVALARREGLKPYPSDEPLLQGAYPVVTLASDAGGARRS